MPKFRVDSWDADGVRDWLRQRRGLRHLRVREHGELLVLESGPAADPFPHARLRRVTQHLWRLEMPVWGDRWEVVPVRAARDELLDMLVADFGWTLQPALPPKPPRRKPAKKNPRRTSDRRY